MTRKTESINDLVKEVLKSLPQPYGEDIIEDVFLAIENNATWKKEYDFLNDTFLEGVVNQMIGKYTKDLTGKSTLREVDAHRSKLTRSYSKLV